MSIRVSDSIIPLGEFRTHTSRYLEDLRNGSGPLVITQHGRAAGVLLSPEEYDALVYQRHLAASIERGMADADAGRVHTTDEAREILQQRRKNRGAKDGPMDE